MQPYFLPYIGYFQLIAAVDIFVVYDRIKYTKKGWINRNRLLVNGTASTFSLPLRKGFDALDVVERELTPDFNRANILNQFSGAYRRAPYFDSTFELLERIVCCKDNNLFGYIHHSLITMCTHLEIGTSIRISSTLSFDNGLKGQDKVIAICEAVGAKFYTNSIGGIEIYSKKEFAAHGIELQFLKPEPFEYLQFGISFEPWLSIVDVLMFNPLDRVREQICTGFELLGDSS
jgi:hypothetical protein